MTHAPKRSHLLVATVFSASLLGLCLAIALPFVLAPTEYVFFSLNLALVQLVTSVAFEWIRVSILRHAGGDQTGDRPARGDIRSLFTIMVLLLLLLAAVLGTLSIWMAELQTPALVCATAAAQGMFDGRSAWARATFDNLRLSIAAFARPVLSLAVVVALAFLTRSGAWALVGLCVSYLLASLFFGDRPSGMLVLTRLDRSRALSLLRFGTMAALGTNIAMAVPAALRSVLVVVLGSSAAGGALLALDISQRVFSTMGMSLNLLNFQTLVHTFDNRPIQDAGRHARAAIAVEVALFAGIVVALGAAAAPVGALLAPASYQQDFARHLPLIALLMAILCLRQYAIDPLFIACRRVAFIAVAPAVTLALFGLSLLATHTGLVAREHLYVLLVAAGAAGFVLPFVFVRGFLPGAIPFDALLASGIAAACAVALTNGVGVSTPILDLMLRGAASLGVYGAVLAVLALLQQLWRWWRAPLLPAPADDARSDRDSPTRI